jgi:hypothetical protein
MDDLIVVNNEQDEFDIPEGSFEDTPEERPPRHLSIVDTPSDPTHWSPLFVFEIALAVDPIDEILLRHEVEEDEFAVIQQSRVFRRELTEAKKEIAEQGYGFKRKSAIQAELYLKDMDLLMQSTETAASVKVDIFKTLAKMGDLEPEKKVASKDGGAEGSQFNIQINIDR